MQRRNTGWVKLNWANAVSYVVVNHQWRSQEFDLGVYVLTSHCNFKTC